MKAHAGIPIGWDYMAVEDLKSPEARSLAAGPFGSSISSKFFVDEGVPVIRGGNLSLGKERFISKGFAFITPSKADEFKGAQVKAGDLVFTCWGTLGQVGIIPPDGPYPVYVISNKQLKFRPDPKKASSRFLYYYFASPSLRQRFNDVAIGAAVPGINLGILKREKIPLPQLVEQQKIAAILTAYDDLIENNSQRIALLEKTAEEIYREWFVRLRFPGHENTTFEKGLPSNWSIKAIGELCSLVTDGAHASPPSVDEGKAMASVKDMTAHGFDLSSARKISEADFERLTSSNCRPEQGDVLIAKDGSYLKHVFVFSGDQEAVILSSIAILRPNLDRVLPYFFAQILRQDSTKAMMAGYVSGVAVPRIILKDFKKMKLLIPHMGLMLRYEEFVKEIYQQMKALLESNKHLARCRDLLLNRLISGKLRVDDLDIQFPPSMQEDAA